MKEMNKKIEGMELLSEEELANAAGGVLFDASDIIGADPAHPYEILNNQNGNVIARFSNKQDAINYAHAQWGWGNAMDTMDVNWDQVQILRGQKMP
ncbi:MAG: hypothetical protein IKR47_04580 [Lachnospiraceae bacterium]|nr:hypothetical protein [Lachnospiraceae bacterium]